MIKYDNKIVLEKDYNDTVSGVKSDYRFYGFKTIYVLGHITGNNVICISAYLTKPNIREYERVEYFENLSDFLNSDDRKWLGTYSLLFKSVDNKNQALEIIEDIKTKHNLL